MKNTSNNEGNFICRICGQSFKSFMWLGRHINNEHDVKEYFIKYIMEDSDNDGSCVNCGKPTQFRSLSKGFKKTCSKECQNIDNSNFIKENGHCGSRDFWKRKGLSDKEIDEYMKNKSIFCESYWEDKSKDPLSEVKKVQSINGLKKSKKVKENPKKYAKTFQNKKEYWMDKGYTESEAIRIVSKRQTTFSKEICIKKYGKTDGIIIWQARQDKWQKTLLSKSPEEILQTNIKKRPFRYSKESIKVLSKLKTKLESAVDFSDLYWKENERFIYNKEEKQIYFYDFTIPSLSIIVEYDGCAWHPSSSMTIDEMKSIKVPFSNNTLYDVYLKDKLKENLAEKEGYKVFRIYSKMSKQEIETKFNEIINYALYG